MYHVCVLKIRHIVAASGLVALAVAGCAQHSDQRSLPPVTSGTMNGAAAHANPVLRSETRLASNVVPGTEMSRNTTRVEATFVDPKMVGTWRTIIDTPSGINLQSWHIDPTGRYSFTTEGPHTEPEETGQAHFQNGHLDLHSTSGSSNSLQYIQLDQETVAVTASGKERQVWMHVADSFSMEAKPVKEPLVDARLIGSWRTLVTSPGKASIATLNIARNGQYHLSIAGTSAAFEQSGQIVAANGRWSIIKNGGTTEYGSYNIRDGMAYDSTVASTGKLSIWMRAGVTNDVTIRPGPNAIVPALRDDDSLRDLDAAFRHLADLDSYQWTSTEASDGASGSLASASERHDGLELIVDHDQQVIRAIEGPFLGILAIKVGNAWRLVRTGNQSFDGLSAALILDELPQTTQQIFVKQCRSPLYEYRKFSSHIQTIKKTAFGYHITIHPAAVMGIFNLVLARHNWERTTAFADISISNGLPSKIELNISMALPPAGVGGITLPWVKHTTVISPMNGNQVIVPETLMGEFVELRGGDRDRKFAVLPSRVLTTSTPSQPVPSVMSSTLELVRDGKVLEGQGHLDEARNAFQQALKEDRRASGDHASMMQLQCLTDIADCLYAMGLCQRAAPVYQQAIEMSGLLHPHSETYDLAKAVYGLGLTLIAEEEYEQALPLLRHAAEINQQLKAGGLSSADFTAVSADEGMCLNALGRYAEAQPFVTRSIEMSPEVRYDESQRLLGEALSAASEVKKTAGTRSGELANALALERVANCYNANGSFWLADRYYRSALTSQARANHFAAPNVIVDNMMSLAPANDPFSVSAQHEQGRILLELGDYSGAEHCLEQTVYSGTGGFVITLQRAKKDWDAGTGRLEELLISKTSPDILSDWARSYEGLGDFVNARLRFEQALAVAEQNRRSSTSLHPGAVDVSFGVTGSPIHHETDGEVAYARVLNDFGKFQLASGHIAEAESMLLKALNIRSRMLELGPDYADGLEALAEVYQATGQLDKVEPLYLQAQSIRLSTLGQAHPAIAKCNVKLAKFYARMGKFGQAESLCLGALTTYQQMCASASAWQSEREQLGMQLINREALDLHLSLSESAHIAPSAVYEPILSWKGGVSLRQRRIRSLLAHTPEQSLPEGDLANDLAPFTEKTVRTVREACDRLQALSIKLATTVMSTPDNIPMGDVRVDHLGQTEEEIEELERQLAEAWRASGQVDVDVSTSQLVNDLPPEVALVDIVQYTRLSAAPGDKTGLVGEPSLTAFVLRRGHEVKRVELGPSAMLTQQVAVWLTTYGNSAAAKAAASKLRAMVWKPLQPWIGDAGIVLVSPDGPLVRLPLGALPSEVAGHHFLIEDVPMAIVPIPQDLAELIAPGRPANAPQHSSLLVVDGVEYTAAAPQAPRGIPKMLTRAEVEAAFGDRLPPTAPFAVTVHENQVAAMNWPRLDETRVEKNVIEDCFQAAYPSDQSLELSTSKVPPEIFCSQAPHFEFLHIATHGFFGRLTLAPSDNDLLPVQLLQAIDTNQRSGLAMAMAATNPAQPRPTVSATTQQVQLESAMVNHARQAVAGLTPSEVFRLHPSLLSGLVLSGGDRAGGILTAMQIEELDLHQAELVTLAACDTGKGENSPDESLLSLQRACQIAGARSVVATLWRVDRACPGEIMKLFYGNLWKKGDASSKPMSKVMALVNAQRELINHSGDHGVFAPGGVVPLPPKYWAEFELSGDWR